MDRLQAVADVGQGARHDHAHRVIEVAHPHLVLDADGSDVAQVVGHGSGSPGPVRTRHGPNDRSFGHAVVPASACPVAAAEPRGRLGSPRGGRRTGSPADPVEPGADRVGIGRFELRPARRGSPTPGGRHRSRPRSPPRARRNAVGRREVDAAPSTAAPRPGPSGRPARRRRSGRGSARDRGRRPRGRGRAGGRRTASSRSC